MINFIVGLLSGFLGSIGVGGGCVLVIYLILFTETAQRSAQGINLIFFIPCAVIGLIFHFKNKLVKWKTALPIIALGIIGVIAGLLIGGRLNDNLLKRIFGGFLLLISVYQIYSVFQSNKSKKSNNS